jgi:hypothetical protein
MSEPSTLPILPPEIMSLIWQHAVQDLLAEEQHHLSTTLYCVRAPASCARGSRSASRLRNPLRDLMLVSKETKMEADRIVKGMSGSQTYLCVRWCSCMYAIKNIAKVAWGRVSWARSVWWWM